MPGLLGQGHPGNGWRHTTHHHRSPLPAVTGSQRNVWEGEPRPQNELERLLSPSMPQACAQQSLAAPYIRMRTVADSPGDSQLEGVGGGTLAGNIRSVRGREESVDSAKRF